MDPKQISSLAKLLRDNGDKVLNSDFRLMLSGPLLRALNDSFSLIIDQNEVCMPQTFQVVKPNYSKSDVFRDLQFVYDFVQKTQHLCITQFQNDEPFDGQIDISKFRSLRKLEIQKVSSEHIVGIQQMRAHLHEIVCTRSIRCVQEIICHCGGDKSNGFIWNELKVADFSFNGLKTIDTSLEFAPWLQNINLSHNKLVSVDAIKWLPNLKVLDLSFNCLTHVPMFHVEAAKKLKFLNLTNNFIEDLSPLSRLDALSELDLSGNCLMDHGSLLPLSTLMALSFLNLKGNPLACHPKHRAASIRYLHQNTASVKFVLDFEPLTKQEKTLTGNYRSYYSILTSRLTWSGSSGQATPVRRTQDNTPTSSVGSTRSIRFDSDEIATSTPGQKKVKVRRVIIADSEEEPVVAAMTKSVASLEGSKDHLETKKQIEDLRKQFGDDWLQSEGATMVESVIGIQTDRSRPTAQETMEKLLQEEKIIEQKLQNVAITEPDLDKKSDKKPGEDSLSVEKNDTESTNGMETDDSKFVTAQSESNAAQSDEDNTSAILTDIYKNAVEEPEISDTESNESLFLCYLQPTNEEVFVVVSDLSIKERDGLTGRTRNKWSIKTLVSCDRTKGDILRINFDTIKRDKKERIYEVTEGLCPKLESLLRDILSKRPLSEMNQTLYRCANCMLHFSRENYYKKQHVSASCPECKSTFVIELAEPKRAQSVEKSIVVPTYPASKKQDDDVNSGSHSSIGSAGSINESSSVSKISRSGSSFDSNQSVAGSSNTDRDRDGDFMKQGESDIEVLSNPSQSSIEVLDSRHSSRKPSEERRILPSLEPITDIGSNHDATTLDLLDAAAGVTKKKKGSKKSKSQQKSVLSGVHLTESSSSGSATDSVCTAYEQSQGTTNVSARADNDDKKDSSKISSMLSGLFNSTNLLMRAKVDNSPSQYDFDKFTYSYTQFDDADHRLKLFFYQSIFEDSTEHFKWLVKGRIFDENQADAHPNGFDGILVMSTTKFYVLQAVAPERDVVSKWLKRYLSCTIDRIEKVGILPWKIGLTFSIKGIGDVHLVLQDILRTDSLLLYFTSNPLPKTCNLEYQISECLQQKLMKLTDNASVIMFAILASCEISADEPVYSWLGLVVTETNFYLLTPSLKWLSKTNGVEMDVLRIQPMTNLVQAEKQNECLYAMNFLDDEKNHYELWKCTFETETCARSTLTAIGHSWEKVFGVSLD